MYFIRQKASAKKLPYENPPYPNPYGELRKNFGFGESIKRCNIKNRRNK